MYVLLLISLDVAQVLTTTVSVLIINAIAILSEDRFLARSTSAFHLRSRPSYIAPSIHSRLRQSSPQADDEAPNIIRIANM